MRAGARANKGQFISARYKDGPNAKPAAKSRQPAQAPTANIAIPAINANNPISDEIKEKIEMFMSEETPYWSLMVISLTKSLLNIMKNCHHLYNSD